MVEPKDSILQMSVHYFRKKYQWGSDQTESRGSEEREWVYEKSVCGTSYRLSYWSHFKRHSKRESVMKH